MHGARNLDSFWERYGRAQASAPDSLSLHVAKQFFFRYLHEVEQEALAPGSARQPVLLAKYKRKVEQLLTKRKMDFGEMKRYRNPAWHLKVL